MSVTLGRGWWRHRFRREPVGEFRRPTGSSRSPPSTSCGSPAAGSPSGGIPRICSARTRIVYGQPTDPRHPESAIPTPWETWTYDPNDNAGRTHPTIDLAQSDHWDTPSSTEIDALGRKIRTVRRGPATDLVTTADYDIDGHPTRVTDPLARTAARTVYDHTGKAWMVWLLNAGTTRSFYDAAGGALRAGPQRSPTHLAAAGTLRDRTASWAQR